MDEFDLVIMGKQANIRSTVVPVRPYQFYCSFNRFPACSKSRKLKKKMFFNSWFVLTNFNMTITALKIHLKSLKDARVSKY